MGFTYICRKIRVTGSKAPERREHPVKASTPSPLTPVPESPNRVPSSSPRESGKEEWQPSLLVEAEREDNQKKFLRLSTRYVHQLQRYLIRHAEKKDRVFAPTFREVPPK